MVFLSIILIVFLVFLPDFYIWLSFVSQVGLLWNILYWMPALMMCALPFAIKSNIVWQIKPLRQLTLSLLFIAIAKCLFVIFSLIGKAFTPLFPIASTIGNYTGLFAVLALLIAVGYGRFFGWKRITTKHINIESDEIPQAFDNYTIVQLSDFHIGTYRRIPDIVKTIVDKVNAINPDAIFFTGDMINVYPGEIKMFIPTLKEMRAKDGIFSILGNHDYCEYRNYKGKKSPDKSLDGLIETEKLLGWTLLRNEHRLIHKNDTSIAVIGVENDGEESFPARADLHGAIGGLNSGIFKILLSHDPSHWRRNVLPETNIQLTLSGHTHAMQLKIGNFSPSQWKYREWGGLYHEGSRFLYVSAGVGSNITFRLGAWPEINVITLRSKS